MNDVDAIYRNARYVCKPVLLKLRHCEEDITAQNSKVDNVNYVFRVRMATVCTQGDAGTFGSYAPSRTRLPDCVREESRQDAGGQWEHAAVCLRTTAGLQRRSQNI